MRLWSEEAFGPVASVYQVADLDEALSIANGLEFGLGSAFWSTNDDEIDRAVREIEAGAVFVNGMTISYAELPFGGIKRSGYGRELSMEGIRVLQPEDRLGGLSAIKELGFTPIRAEFMRNS